MAVNYIFIAEDGGARRRGRLRRGRRPVSSRDKDDLSSRDKDDLSSQDYDVIKDDLKNPDIREQFSDDHLFKVSLWHWESRYHEKCYYQIRSPISYHAIYREKKIHRYGNFRRGFRIRVRMAPYHFNRLDPLFTKWIRGSGSVLNTGTKVPAQNYKSPPNNCDCLVPRPNHCDCLVPLPNHCDCLARDREPRCSVDRDPLWRVRSYTPLQVNIYRAGLPHQTLKIMKIKKYLRIFSTHRVKIRSA